MVQPVRTCVGCRRRTPKSELVRLVWHQAVVLDVGQREPGRGAYLHRGPECLATAIRRRSLARALRAPGVDPEALLEAWEGQQEAGGSA